MVEATLEDSTLLRKAFEAIRDIVQDVNIECTDTGITIQAIDQSHVALVSLSINQKTFSKYNCQENTTLGVNLPALLQILKCSSASGTLVLKSAEQELVLHFEDEGSHLESNFSLNLMEIDAEQLQIPPAEPDAKVTIPSNHFQKVMNDLSQFGDNVLISVDSKSLTLNVKGSSQKGHIILKNHENVDKENAVLIECNEKFERSYSIKYMKIFAKAHSLSKLVILNLSKNRPLLVEFDLSDADGSICYYLAPKVEDDDEEVGE